MAEYDLNIQESAQGAAVVLRVAGKLDARTAPRLGDMLKTMIAGGRIKIVCDLQGVSYIASAGVGTLKAALIDAKKAGGDLRLAALQAPVKDVLDVLGFTRLFSIHSDAAAAAKGL
ncbi:MAG: STAS domain-containing protein [Leptospirales bacterium]|nr:STAS domain-containing protein [Leptospirales bacterium]